MKWKSLVDTFRTKDRSGAEGSVIQEKAKQWKFYEAMSFIRPYLSKCKYVST